MRSHESFDAALAQVQRPSLPQGDDRPEPVANVFSHPSAHVAPEPDLDRSAEIGTGSLWERAFAWVPELEIPEPPPAAAPRAPPTCDPGEIAQELRLAALSTLEDIKRVRRRFMWENHPDRWPEIPVSLANRRVAIANMLIDDAMEALLRKRRAK